MNVQIRDREPFERLNPAEVAAYLRTSGWKEVENQPDRLSIWVAPVDGDQLEIVLPLRRTLGDYVLRMAEVVGTLAAKENRSQLAILDDLQTAGLDVIRIQLGLAEAANGTVTIERGIALYDNIPELFSAGACAAQHPRLYYATKKSKPVSDFVKQLRIGQTEYGSYVVRVLSPVPPSLNGLFGPTEEPFERQAIQSLVQGLDALRKAADIAFASGAGRPFEQAVALGVSANLCDAVAKIAGEDAKPADNLVIRLTAARNRPLTIALPEVISFPGDRIPIIREAARILKAVAPVEDQEIQGYVVKLQAKDDGGIATLSTFIEGQPRKVTINLPEAEHKKAIAAYEQRTEIRCRGVLTKAGQLWSLQEPGRVTVVAEE